MNRSETTAWYAASAQRNGERIAVAHLARQGFRTFLPLRLKTIRHARQFRSFKAPLFPGYLFVALDPARHGWRCINGTRGVTSLVMVGGEPTPVPAGIVEALIAMSAEHAAVNFEHELRLGQRVRMLAGPFAEQLGTLERLDDQGRVGVLLEMMGMSVRVAATARQLVPA